MDNLTHSIVGLGAGEFVHRCLPPENETSSQSTRRRLLLTACALASNLPDADLLLTPLIEKPLGYLLHHRGHTHTLLFVLPQALLLALVIWALWPAARRLLKESRHARIGFASALGAGLLLHLMMDYLNVYGIHPFHPIDSRWFYGDLVFIVEPLFWVAFGVPMAMTIRPRVGRAFLLAALAGVLAYFTFKGHLVAGSLAGLFTVGVVAGLFQRGAGERGRAGLLAAASLSAGFVVLQGWAATTGAQIVVKRLHVQDAGSSVLDVAMVAFPSNPLCWKFTSIESHEEKNLYRLRTGMLSLAPDIMPAASCPATFRPGPLSPSGDAVQFVSQKEESLSHLRGLKDRHCHVEAWLRFARMPSIRGGTALDLRFGDVPQSNFTSMDIERAEKPECRRNIPQWEFPRKDLLK
ncbi:MAG: metal-dependent hydrolase [Paucimonas sp.]|jgi:inner membrane protein|nr:metal-dependent hydrolase [Paucimonas sp.]